MEFKHLVRIANTDLDGRKPLYYALTKIKGVNFMFANMVCHLAKMNRYTKTGELTDSETEVLDNVLKNPIKYNAPAWMLNRRKDYTTGEDKHVITGDLKFATENDIRLLKKIKAYRGIRHIFGLPVRGQRTRSNFRKNKGNVMGVQRKSVAPPKAEDGGKGGKGDKKKGGGKEDKKKWFISLD